jgi:hypothetical protein
MNPITNYCEAILGNNTNAKKTIRLIPELANCSDDLLDLIFTYSKAVNIKQGELLIKEGLFDQWVYFMVKGDLDIYINDVKLGTTSGPLVGERCIVGESRGATLVAGEGGVMAFGIEMSLMDEVNRQINTFGQTEKNEVDILEFSNQKNKIAIELLAIVLNEVILRILDINRTSLYILKRLTVSFKEEGNHQHLVLPNKNHQKIDEEVVAMELLHADFVIFSKKLFDAIIQSNPVHENLNKIKECDWFSILKLADDGSEIYLMDAFNSIAKYYQVPYADLVEVAFQMFEVTSQYTRSLNGSLNSILSLFDNEKAKQSALKSQENDNANNVNISARIELLKTKLFDPIKQALASKDSTTVESVINKLSQGDIDSLFD